MLERKTVDAAEPPRIVFESPAQCRDGDRAEALLRRTLTPALAPAHGWVVTMRVDRTSTKALRAEGEITDGAGAPVAHRTIGGTTADCGGLARAVGVWASLVLDEEVRRASAVATNTQPDAKGAPGTGGPGGATASRGSDETGGETVPGLGAATGTEAHTAEPAAAWPAPSVPEKPSPEHDWYLHHDDERTLEAGAGVFLMTGTGGGALAGPTAYVVAEGGHGLFLRPSVAFGQSLTSLPPSDVSSSTWAAARFDTCLRLPGLYTRHHGMQLDLCAGSDIGFTFVRAGTTKTTLPYLDLGPSIGLRGELGSRLSALLRVVVGVNLIRSSFVDLSGASELPPLPEGRLELAFSWDVR